MHGVRARGVWKRVIIPRYRVTLGLHLLVHVMSNEINAAVQALILHCKLHSGFFTCTANVVRRLSQTECSPCARLYSTVNLKSLRVLNMLNLDWSFPFTRFYFIFRGKPALYMPANCKIPPHPPNVSSHALRFNFRSNLVCIVWFRHRHHLGPGRTRLCVPDILRNTLGVGLEWLRRTWQYQILFCASATKVRC
jgi:hypothetical protein